jgi:hypothetical protein
MRSLPTELLLIFLEKLASDRRELLPPLLEESRLASPLSEARFRLLMPLRLILIRPMMRSLTEEVPMEKPLMVIMSSSPLRLLRLKMRGMVSDCSVLVSCGGFALGFVFFALIED